MQLTVSNRARHVCADVLMYDLTDPDPTAPGVAVFESHVPAWTCAISDNGASVFYGTF